MIQQLRISLARFGTLSIVIFASGFAFADTGVPLYVADTGVDGGDCSSRSQPCASIGYALKVAGKNAQVRVAAGTYSIDDPSDLIYMVSGAVNVTGGHIADNDFSPSANGRSLLAGVPIEYRELVRERGFQVIADAKGIDIERSSQANQLLKTYQSAQVSAAATPCTNGSAAGFSCSGVDLLAHVARQDISAAPGAVADIWGFVDLNTQREYAIIGVSVGTAVFDVTDPENPREVGFVDGQSATWRDIKVYQYFDTAADRWQAYAYVTTDGAGDGLFVLDLGGLPHSISRVGYNSDFTNSHNVYLSNVDFGTGLAQSDDPPQLIAAGSGRDNGQFRSYSLANPAAPAFVRRVAAAGYMHDAASLRISDQRTAQCANAGAPCEVLVDFNEERVEFWDVTDASNPSLLSQANRYTNSGYVHSGWWSEDRQYVYAHDELDERNSGLFSTLRIFSIADLNNPALVGIWTGPTAAIDHNGFVRGNRYYMSNYTRGLTILDLSNPTAPVESGFFDTYGANNNTVFAGAWGAYPFFHSGTVAVSDINSGMYLLQDQTRDVPQGALSFAASSYGAIEGQQASLAVSRIGGTTGAVSVDYEVLSGSLSGNYQAQTGTLSWGAGDAGDKSVQIDAAIDGSSNELKRGIVRLVNPTGGATLGTTNVASLYVGDTSATSQLRFFADSINVTERGFGTAVVVLQRIGSAAGAVSIDYTVVAGGALANTDFQGPSGGTISWADGDADPRTVEFQIVDDGLAEPDESFQLNVSNIQGASIVGAQSVTVTIEDALGNNLAPNAIAGMNQTRTGGSAVVLDGSQSNDPDGDPLTFQWSQTGGGPAVTLQNATSASASFTAPTVSSDTMLQFQLDVSDPSGLTSSATTMVTVTNSTAAPPGGGGGGGGGGATTVLLLLSLSLLARRRVSRTDCA
jgi:choice-of-anchor B domain-containing protein